MTKMTPMQKATAIAALADYQTDQTAGSGYALMRYARRGFLEPNGAVLTGEQLRTEEALLAKIPHLPESGPLPDFYPFLRSARAGHYRLIATAD